MDFGFTEKQISLIKDIFSQFPEISEVIIFGSRAMGNYKKGSDVDLAIKGKIDEKIILKLSRKLNDESPLPHIFDVIKYDDISNEKLKEHISSFGKIFYKKG